MGACQTSDIIENKSKAKTSTKAITKSEMHEKEVHPDMPEWEGDRFTGVGIKRMKGYKCSLPIDELNVLRHKFWNLKYKMDPIWSFIMKVCHIDESQAKEMLKELNFTPVNGCINHLKGKHNAHYFIPNYCLNDPYFEKELKITEVKPSEASVQIVLFEGSKEVNMPITVSNWITGAELKAIYKEKAKIPPGDFKFRLFFSGSEIKDEHCLYQHKVKDNFKVQVMRFAN